MGAVEVDFLSSEMKIYYSGKVEASALNVAITCLSQSCFLASSIVSELGRTGRRAVWGQKWWCTPVQVTRRPKRTRFYRYYAALGWLRAG